MKKLLAIVTVLGLAALPLSAQAQDPPAEEPSAQDLDYGAETQPLEEPGTTPPAEDRVDPVERTDGTSDESVADADQDELPRTASPLGLIAALGIGCTAAGLGLRRLRTR